MNTIPTQTLTDTASAIRIYMREPNKTAKEMSFSLVGGLLVGESQPFSARFDAGKNECLGKWLSLVEKEIANRI